jgi:predicted amidohydrolase
MYLWPDSLGSNPARDIRTLQGTFELRKGQWQAGHVTTLRVALIQQASSLDPEENRDALGAVAEVADTADLVVFPECFMRDFGRPGSNVSEFAEDLDGPFVSRMTALAKEYDVTVVAGMFERSEDPTRPYNTLAVVDADGVRASYRKIHLYDSFGYKESDSLLAGPIEPVLVDVGGFTLGLMTCYDLRFPELARELVARGATLLVVPTAWVAGPRKVDHWRTFVKARAIENTVYVAAAAQPAPRYSGHSMVVAPNGQVLGEAEDGDRLVHAEVSTEELDRARAQNPSLANRRM